MPLPLVMLHAAITLQTIQIGAETTLADVAPTMPTRAPTHVHATNVFAGWMCALVTLCSMLITDPRAEIGISDDWSYIYTAKRLAETSHVYYNGWAAPILGAQLYLGALFIRLFGFSFTTVRASSMLVSVLAVPVMHALMMRSGIRAWNATLGTLTLALSPLYLPLATTFMSDSFAMFALVLFFYACVRCVSSDADRDAVLWLVMAAVVGVMAGSVRQIAWLGVLISFPCLLWLQRQRRTVLRVGLLAWTISGVAVTLMLRWFSHQPNVSVEPLIDRSTVSLFLPVVGMRAAFSCLVFLSPVIVGVALRVPQRRGVLDRRLVWTLATVAFVVGALTYINGASWWGNWMLGNVTTGGVLWRADMLGPRPQIIPGWAQVVLAFFVLASTSACTASLWLNRRYRSETFTSKTDEALPWIATPFSLAYLFLVFTRTNIFDRYFLPLLLLAMIAALRWYERRFSARLSRLCIVPIVLLGYYAVAGTHDVFAEGRAKLAAANELRSAGLSRTAFSGGFEYDGWTQVDSTGFVNEPRIRPATAYHLVALPSGLAEEHPSDAFDWQHQLIPGRKCYTWFRGAMPSVHPQFTLERAPGYCFAESDFPAVTYRTWLPPYAAGIYIATVPAKYQ